MPMKKMNEKKSNEKKTSGAFEIGTSDEEMLLQSPIKGGTSTPKQTNNANAHDLALAAKKFAERPKHGANVSLIKPSILSSTPTGGTDTMQMRKPNTNTNVNAESTSTTKKQAKKSGSDVTLNLFIKPTLVR